MNFISSDLLPLKGAALSMQGGRLENQDDYGFIDTPLGFLLVVCDGMGGGPGGKTASLIAKQEIASVIYSANSESQAEFEFKKAVSHAQEVMEQKVVENPALDGMGSTFVAVLVSQKSAFIAHAGDSRCYMMRGSKCIHRTTDHSLVAELVRKKVMTEEEARVSPQSNVIGRGLGSTTNHVPEIIELPYKKGDRFFLCTDGIWGAMPQKDLLARIGAKADLVETVERLSAEVDRIGYASGGTHDNHTIAAFETQCDSLTKPLITDDISLGSIHNFLRRSWKKLFLALVALVLIVVAAKTVRAIVDLFLDNTPEQIEITNYPVNNPSFTPKPPAVTPPDEAASGRIAGIDSLIEEAKRQHGEKTDSQPGNKNEKEKGSTVDKDKDPGKKAETQEPEKPKDIGSSIDKIIKLYDKAKDVKANSVESAAREAEKIQKEIVDGLVEAIGIVNNSSLSNKAEIKRNLETIKTNAAYSSMRIVNKLDENGISRPTAVVLKKMDSQIEQLKKVKEMIQGT